MRIVGHSILIATVAMAVACQSSDVAMESFSSEAGRFAIETPAPFVETDQSVPTPVGPVEIRTFTAETDESAYVVAYSDYPETIVQQTDPEMLLDSSRDGAVSNLGGTLAAEENISLEGYPGRSLTIETGAATGDPATIYSHIYLIENRLYQVLVVSPEGKDQQKVADRFLASFSLNP